MVATFDADATRHTTDGYAEMIQSFDEENSIVSSDVELAAKKNEYINIARPRAWGKAPKHLTFGATSNMLKCLWGR